MAHVQAAARPHLPSLIEDWRRSGRDTAIVEHRGNRTFRTTYGSLAELAGRFAAELERRKIGAGERVVLWGWNSATWVAAFFGCVLRGVLVVPLDATGSPAFAQRVIAEVAPRLVVGEALLLGALEREVPQLALEALAEVLPHVPDLRVESSLGLETPLQIVFTSGTTSEPKGVVHTHGNVLASVGPIEAEIAFYRRYERPFHPLRFLHTLPLSHVFGQFMGLWLPPLLAAEVHFTDAMEPSRLVGLAKRERVSVLVAVPRVLELLRVHLQQRFPWLQREIQGALQASGSLPAWKRWWRFRAVHRALGFKFWALICGGATLPADLEAFWNGLGLALIQGYGMTETAALVTLNHPLRVGKGTLGKALPGREVRLRADGEIEVRGAMLAAGSWQHGKFQPRVGEWLSTGDLGVADERGDLRFAGRKGDVIVTAAGMNVHPQDLEAALLTQPGVRECAVVGCETSRGVEPVAVVLFGGSATELRTVREAANAQLAGFQQMSHVLVWPEPAFPYTATGKLLRRRIAAWASAQITTSSGTGASPGMEPSRDLLLAAIAEITRKAGVQGDDAQRLAEDLHLDSLGRVQLQSVLETQLGVEVSDEAISAVMTLGELRKLTGLPPGGGAAALQTTVGAREVNATSETAMGLPIRFARWPWSRPVRWLRVAFVEVVLRPLVRVLAAPRVFRNTATLAKQGPMLVVANHVNVYDVPLLLYALPGSLRRHLAAAMSAEVLHDLRRGRGQGNHWLNLLARPAYWLLVMLFNVFPLPRLRGFRQSFAHAGEALDQGYSVLVFPEGRRSGDGTLQPFRPGIGLLVQASDVQVLPVALQGMGLADGRWFRTGRVAVRMGEPVRFARGTSAEAITRTLERTLRALGSG